MIYPPSDRWPGVAARLWGWCSMVYPPSGRCGLVCLQGCGDSALRSTRHQVGVAWCACKVVGIVLYDLPAIRSVAWCGCKVVSLQGSGDGALRSTRHQIGGLVWLQGCEVARFRDGALWSTRHQIGVVPGVLQLKCPVLIISKYRAFGLRLLLI